MVIPALKAIAAPPGSFHTVVPTTSATRLLGQPGGPVGAAALAAALGAALSAGGGPAAGCGGPPHAMAPARPRPAAAQIELRIMRDLRWFADGIGCRGSTLPELRVRR